MPKFVWEGVTRSGETRKGAMEAPDEDTVVERLREQQLNIKKVKKAPLEINLQFGTGVEIRDLLIFTRQLATMIDAGLPLVQCLDILASQTENKAFAKVLENVKRTVESGATFSEALGKHPKIFDELYVNLVAAGEVGGILDTILNRLSAYIEKAEKLRRQIKSAMVYPISVLCIAAIVVAVMLLKVIPVFENMYKEFKGAKLPAPTQVVLNISNSFQASLYWFFGSVAAFILLIKLAKRT